MTTASVAPDDWRSWPPEAKARLRWRLQARPEQLTPGTDGAAICASDWNIWLILAGRGYGKTRTGAEDMANYAYNTPGARLAVIAPSFGDARDTCVEGESGLLAVIPKPAIEAWNRSMGELRLVNGSQFKLFSAEEPERLRGPQHHRAWCDELAAWEYLDETWDMMMFGLRLGEHPQVVATTTPKPRKKIRELIKRAENPTDVILQRGSTFDNAANLAKPALDELKRRYAGTRLGRQELDAEVLDEVEGALWTIAGLDMDRVDRAWVPDTLMRVVVGVDPATSSGEDADETGIIVVAKAMCHRCNAREPHGFVLHDSTQRRAGPAVWAKAAIRSYYAWHADKMVPERNNGGEMVEHTIRTVDPMINVKSVWASHGKKTRAEPVAMLYEQHKIHHVGIHAELEDQMTTWDPDSEEDSPDRVDALVWALTDLFIGKKLIKTSGKVPDNRLAGRR